MTDAKKAKNDEFYTQLSDIENELSHYRQYFRGKTVFCNCDDPEYSNFWKYFELNFEHFGLKRLIATHFDSEKPSYMLELVRDVDGDGHINGKDIIRTPLRQNGDFRSPECIELMRQADVVVTNPPFSLFREYVTQLMELEKKLVIIGNKNAVTYKEIFPLLKGGKLWVGNRHMNSDMWLYVPDSKPFEKVVNNRHAKHIMACWYTNLDITKRHEEMILYRTYRGHEDEYPTYDNYDAIYVDKVCDIPPGLRRRYGRPDHVPRQI